MKRDNNKTDADYIKQGLSDDFADVESRNIDESKLKINDEIICGSSVAEQAIKDAEIRIARREIVEKSQKKLSHKHKK